MATPPQTNQVGRAAAFVGALLPLGVPLHLCEIGASAGLNLQLDRFRCRVGERVWGPHSSPVEVCSTWDGDAPSLAGELCVVGRRGCDPSPLCVSEPAHRARLRAFVWADHPQRLRLLDDAIEGAMAVNAWAAIVVRPVGCVAFD